MDAFGPRHILAATDGSPLSTAAVGAAADLARTSGAMLTVVTCTRPIPGMSADARAQLHVDLELAAAAEEARRHLQEAVAVAQAHGSGAAQEHAYAEEPFKGILDTARAHGCDLIVAASRGRGRAAGLLFGSQTMALLVHSELPLLVCPEGVPPAWNHILVAIDGTQASESTVAVGAELARVHAGKLTLLMCSPLLSSGGEPGGIDSKAYEAFARHAAAGCLASAAAAARNHGIEASCVHAFAAAPWRTIVDTARAVGAGLICMASRKRSGRLEAAITSESLKVLTHAPVAVLVCRAPEEEEGAKAFTEAAA